MKKTPAIQQIPDYPSIKKLASALFRLDASHHGAAIMIGAGFSRSAAIHVGGHKKMPLWNQFTKSLIQDLYPNTPDISFTDPLRVAEEFRAYYGQAALNDRIRFEIENEAWLPGTLHKQLLQLPWSEILTTNWDTLLEQAAASLSNPYYTPVTKTSDLAWAQSPRIVKLHGTIGITDTFIAAQEDYRTYPVRFAPFVNLARQVFIENELCLLGFSGDDPNFLQWAGWVRDHLANHARRIYLVGALNLSAAQRKQLESMNVAPIDLWPLVARYTDPDLRHQKATEHFLETMVHEAKARIRPHEWSPAFSAYGPGSAPIDDRAWRDPTLAANILSGQIDALRQDRQSYPGWIICPPSLRWHLAHQITHPFPTPENIAALAPEVRAKLLYEIAWRHSIAFEHIPPWLANAMFSVVNPEHPTSLSVREQLEMAVALLHNARLLEISVDDDRHAVIERNKTLIQILETHSSYLPDCAAEIAYYQALVARDLFDYEALAAIVQKIVGQDPIWKLRRASLHMELRQSDEASQLIAQAYGELRESHRRDRHSIPVLSKLVWAHWLLQAVSHGNSEYTVEDLPAFAESHYREWKCDPQSWLQDFHYKIDDRRDKYFERQNSIEPLFEQGCYRQRSDHLSLDRDISPFLMLDGLTRTIGIPLTLYTGHIDVTLLANDAEKILVSGGVGMESVDGILAIRSARSEDSISIKNLFTRIGVACVKKETADNLIDRLLKAVNYWRQERIHGSTSRQANAISALRVFVEVLARFSLRTTPAKAKEIFNLAVSLGQQPEMQHIWLFQVIGNLLNHSLKSIPNSEHGELLEHALAFPLPHEINLTSGRRWPNPIINHPGHRATSKSLDVRISELIDAIASKVGNSRTYALQRIFPLAVTEDFLTLAERKKLGVAIWGNSPKYKDIPETGLYPNSLLYLPSKNTNRAEKFIRSYLYEHDIKILDDTQKEIRCYPSPEIEQAVMVYGGIANAALDSSYPIFPSEKQASLLFDRITNWRPGKFDDGTFGFFNNSIHWVAHAIGNALSSAITPALDGDSKTHLRLKSLANFYIEVEDAQSALPAFVYFAKLDKASEIVVSKTIKSALRSQDDKRVSYAALALKRWMDLSNTEQSSEFATLASMAISIIESGRIVGLPQLLWLAEEMVRAEKLPQEQITMLLEVVPSIFEATKYTNISDPNSREAVNASSVRASSVRLAKALDEKVPHISEIEHVIKKSLSDALPEVRFALRPFPETFFD